MNDADRAARDTRRLATLYPTCASRSRRRIADLVAAGDPVQVGPSDLTVDETRAGKRPA